MDEVLEGDDVRDGTAFNMTMESNKIDETNFMISVSANCIKKIIHLPHIHICHLDAYDC